MKRKRRISNNETAIALAYIGALAYIFKGR